MDTRVLRIEGLEKHIANTIIFPQINLEIHAGEILAIQTNPKLGNQFMEVLAGVLPKSGGHIYVLNQQLNNNHKDFCGKIGIVLQNDNLYGRLTVKAYIEFYKRLYNVNGDISFILEVLGLLDKMSFKIKKLTMSEQKRVQIARSILHHPDLIIFEDPEQHVDIESKMIIRKVINELANQGRAVLLSTSYLESAISLTNNVYQLNEEGLKKVNLLNENEQITQLGRSDDKFENQNIEEVVSPKEHETSSDFFGQYKLKIPAKLNGKIILFDPAEIDFIESIEGVSNLHVRGEIFPCSISLNELDERLSSSNFFRCHRSYIINLHKVREIKTWTRNSYGLILKNENKDIVPLSKNCFYQLKKIVGL